MPELSQFKNWRPLLSEKVERNKESENNLYIIYEILIILSLIQIYFNY